MNRLRLHANLRRLSLFVFLLLVIEFLDEFVFGVYEAALPLIRDDLGLSYQQIGLLLSVPSIIASFIEPVLGILGDTGKRRLILLGGGVVFALELFAVAVSSSFLFLLIAFILFYPASGAFVNLAQATLMDSDPSRHEHNMARWTFAGSLGVVGGSLALVVSGSNWRGMFWISGAMTLVALMVIWKQRHLIPQTGNGANSDGDEEEEAIPFMTGFKNAFAALKRREVVRWLTLLEFSDLLLDGLHGFLALYFVDVAGTNPQTAALGVAVWTGVGLVGDFLLIPLLERVNGLTYLRYSVVIEMILFPLFLIVSPTPLKLLILAFIGLFNAGWYAILQGRLYSVMPGQSGSVMAIGNVSGLFGGLIPVGLGVVAQHFGLHIAMWLFMAGPIALMIGLPRHNGVNPHE